MDGWRTTQTVIKGACIFLHVHGVVFHGVVYARNWSTGRTVMTTGDRLSNAPCSCCVSCLTENAFQNKSVCLNLYYRCRWMFNLQYIYIANVYVLTETFYHYTILACYLGSYWPFSPSSPIHMNDHTSRPPGSWPLFSQVNDIVFEIAPSNRNLCHWNVNDHDTSTAKQIMGPQEWQDL